jgi:Ca2+:H+ antiporter
MLATLSRSQRVAASAALALTVAAAALHAASVSNTAQFIVDGLALAAVAAVIGQAVEEVGERLGPNATGVVQSTLGNVPEFFVGLFALRDGLTQVVQATIAGSVLANVLLVLGSAFILGGLRHGVQRFPAEGPRIIATLLVLAVGALIVPTFAVHLGTPASHHANALSIVCSVALLVVYVASLPSQLKRSAPNTAAGTTGLPEPPPHPAERAEQPAPPSFRPEANWPFPLALVMLTAASVAAAFVSDWFVASLTPATRALGLSQTFTGLVIVAIASNAVEHAVGVRFALRGRPDFAISTTLNSPLQVALLLAPVLVLISQGVGPTALTLVFPPLLVAALAVASVVVVVVIYDGEYTWIEGVALVGLYTIIAAAFWWG